MRLQWKFLRVVKIKLGFQIEKLWKVWFVLALDWGSAPGDVKTRLLWVYQSQRRDCWLGTPGSSKSGGNLIWVWTLRSDAFKVKIPRLEITELCINIWNHVLMTTSWKLHMVLIVWKLGFPYLSEMLSCKDFYVLMCWCDATNQELVPCLQGKWSTTDLISTDDYVMASELKMGCSPRCWWETFLSMDRERSAFDD